MMIVAKHRRPTVAIRKRSNNQTHIAFSASVVRELGLKRGAPVLMYLDEHFARFKVQLAAADDVGQARHFVADGDSSALLICCSGLDPKRFRRNKYDPITSKAGWISIDLDAPRKGGK